MSFYTGVIVSGSGGMINRTVSEPCPKCRNPSLRMQYIRDCITKHYCYLCGYREYRDFDGGWVFHTMVGEELQKEIGSCESL